MASNKGKVDWGMLWLTILVAVFWVGVARLVWSEWWVANGLQ